MKKKGIILAGGLGTRLFPLTIPVSKPLLPVYDKPMIYYPLATLMLAGIRDVLIIIREEDSKHCTDLLGDGSFLGMNISYAYEKETKGIAPAFIIGEKFIGNDGVCLILGDNIFYEKNLHQTLHNIHKYESGASVFAKEVEDPEKYGVIQKNSRNEVEKLLEKPKNPPSNFAVTGLYFYDNSVVDIAKTIAPSERGEYEITAVNNVYLENRMLRVTTFEKSLVWFDTGRFSTLLKAANFIRQEQEEKGNMVGCVELIAHKNGWISSDQLEKIIKRYEKSGYLQNLSISYLK